MTSGYIAVIPAYQPDRRMLGVIAELGKARHAKGCRDDPEAASRFSPMRKTEAREKRSRRDLSTSEVHAAETARLSSQWMLTDST